MFCRFTGLAYADVEKLAHDDIHTDERGDLWIVDDRQKTGTRFRVKLYQRGTDGVVLHFLCLHQPKDGKAVFVLSKFQSLPLN